MRHFTLPPGKLQGLFRNHPTRSIKIHKLDLSFANINRCFAQHRIRQPCTIFYQSMPGVVFEVKSQHSKRLSGKMLSHVMPGVNFNRCLHSILKECSSKILRLIIGMSLAMYWISWPVQNQERLSSSILAAASLIGRY